MELDASGTQLLNFPVDGAGDDPKHLTELSTLLVATIQEAKDRISQVEFIFCSRLFPAFQSRFKTLQARISEAQEAAAEEWRKQEEELLLEIKGLMVDKQRDAENWRREKAEMLSSHAAEKDVLMAKLEGLEKNEVIVAELREQLRVKTAELAENKDTQERFLKLIEEKQEDMVNERRKRRRVQESWKELSDRYRQIKSQYKFLLKKSGLVCADDETEVDLGLPSPVTPLSRNNIAGTEGKCEDITSLASDVNELHDKFVSLEKANNNRPSSSRPSSTPDEKNIRSINPSSSGIHVYKYTPVTNPMPEVGNKRSVSSWRDTRVNTVQRGIDPHDDFLDTPLENVRETLKNPTPQVEDIPALPPNDMDFNTSDDDETQNITSQVPKAPITIAKPGNKGFKYVEPVRKKAERENLQGYECKQCKKFYDAVHPTGDTNGNIRCEHHGGVSRHRYKFAPPSTPEGFWNIGFDSEI